MNKQIKIIDDVFWCPECGYQINAKGSITVEGNIKFELTKICMQCMPYCPICLKDKKYNMLAYLDKLISKSILLLNKKGYKTSFSCQGHSIKHINNDSILHQSYPEMAYIRFSEIGTNKLAKNKIKAPENWHYEVFQKHVGIYYDNIIMDTDESKKLLEWVESLPL